MSKIRLLIYSLLLAGGLVLSSGCTVGVSSGAYYGGPYWGSSYHWHYHHPPAYTRKSPNDGHIGRPPHRPPPPNRPTPRPGGGGGGGRGRPARR